VTEMQNWLTDVEQGAGSGGILPAYLFRYMGTDGLSYTVGSKQLRMNAWSAMNDPRESHRWTPPGDFVTATELDADAVARRVDDALRGASKLLSLTSDRDPADEASKAYPFHRGWARAALWAHYAGNHSGVCMVLDTTEVMSAIGNLPPRDRRYTFVGRVEYVDGPLDIALHDKVDDETSLDEAIEKLLDAKGTIEHLHLTKNRDWSYEAEVRMAVVHADAHPDDLHSPLYVPLGSALKAVILGEAHPSPAMTAAGVKHLLQDDPPEIYSIGWSSGIPTLAPI
jgi:hypothetical protein